MILYRTSGPWGAGIGSNLSAVQVDGNFYDVAQRVQFLEQNPARPVQITSFSVSASNFYIHMSDGSVQGPLPLPAVRWNFRGNWLVSTFYAIDDVFVGPDGAVYIVIFDHTSSASTFDPHANNGAAHDFYSLLLSVPAVTLPAGGNPGSVLIKASFADYDWIWGAPQAPSGGSTGQVLQKNSVADADASWATLGLNDLRGNVSLGTPSNWDYLRWNAATSRWINQQPFMLNVLRTTSWSPVAGNEGAFTVLTNGTADATVIIPADSTQPFQLGTELTIHQDGTGVITVAGDVGVAVLKHANFTNKLLGQYATATVKKTAANEWRLFGLLAIA